MAVNNMSFNPSNENLDTGLPLRKLRSFRRSYLCSSPFGGERILIYPFQTENVVYTPQ